MSLAALNAYEVRDCIRCGAGIRAPRSRIAHVFGQHAERCEIATPEERVAFRRSGRWPKGALCSSCKAGKRRTPATRGGVCDPCAAAFAAWNARARR